MAADFGEAKKFARLTNFAALPEKSPRDFCRACLPFLAFYACKFPQESEAEQALINFDALA